MKWSKNKTDTLRNLIHEVNDMEESIGYLHGEVQYLIDNRKKEGKIVDYLVPGLFFAVILKLILMNYREV